MGLDIHVMPLSRFLGGRYESPLEKLLGSKVQRVGSPKPAEDDLAVAKEIASLKLRVAREASGVVDWDESSEPALGLQYTYDGYSDLRGFAGHQEYPRTEGWLKQRPVPFRVEKDIERYTGFMDICAKKKPTAYPHLLLHADTHGYWLPVRFKQPILLHPESYLVAGSSPMLLEELDRLAPLLQMTRDWGQIEKGRAAHEDGDPLGSVKYGWAVLHYAARVSVEKRMPVIFDG